LRAKSHPEALSAATCGVKMEKAPRKATRLSALVAYSPCDTSPHAVEFPSWDGFSKAF